VAAIAGMFRLSEMREMGGGVITEDPRAMATKRPARDRAGEELEFPPIGACARCKMIRPPIPDNVFDVLTKSQGTALAGTQSRHW